MKAYIVSIMECSLVPRFLCGGGHKHCYDNTRVWW